MPNKIGNASFGRCWRKRRKIKSGHAATDKWELIAEMSLLKEKGSEIMWGWEEMDSNKEGETSEWEVT